jgi:hypothetical protein
MSLYQREFLRALFDDLLQGVERRRFVLTADRWFADVDLLDLLDELGVAYIIRTKSSYKVRVEGRWRELGNLGCRGNQQRRAWGRVWYCEGDPCHSDHFRSGLRIIVSCYSFGSSQVCWAVES